MATLWSGQEDLAQALRRWSWCRAAWPKAFARATGNTAANEAADVDALSQAFFEWAEALDANAQAEQLDRVDFAHYGAGLLLQALVRQASLVRALGIAPLLTLALTVLDAWRRALGQEPVVLMQEALQGSNWASFEENVREDARCATAFVDRFTGIEPAWSSPALALGRPAIQRALAARQGSAAG